MRDQIPIVADWERNPDVAILILLVDRPPALELHLAQLATALAVENEVDASIVDRQEHVEALCQGEAGDGVPVDDLFNLLW